MNTNEWRWVPLEPTDDMQLAGGQAVRFNITHRVTDADVDVAYKKLTLIIGPDYLQTYCGSVIRGVLEQFAANGKP